MQGFSVLQTVGGRDGDTTKRLWAIQPRVPPSFGHIPPCHDSSQQAKQSADGGAAGHCQPRACCCAGERDTFFRGEKPLQEGEEQ